MSNFFKKTPRVTFLIPCFNGEDFIAESLRSACEQEFDSYEVIVVDDGSSDNSRKIIKMMRKKFEFRYVFQENEGVCGAMNTGLSLAQGEYFCWGGHDDIFFPHRIQVHADFLDKNDEYVACFSNVEYINSEGQHIGYGKTNKIKSGNILDELFYRNFIPAPAAMVRTSAVRSIGGFSTKYLFEDYPLWLALAEISPIGFVDDIVTRYRVHDKNMSGENKRFYVATQEILEDWIAYPACRKALRYWYRRWFCDPSKGHDVMLTDRYLRKLKPSDFLRPRIVRSYVRYLVQRNGLST